MKKILSLILIFIISLHLVFSTGCTKKPQKYTDYSFDYFDTVTTIIGFEESEDTFKQNCEKIKGWLLEYHRLYDIYTVYDGVTNLCVLNKSQGKTLTADQKIIDLLQFSKEVYAKTDKLNVAMGSVLSIWHDYREYALKNPQKAALPPLSDLSQASKHTNFNDIVIDDKNKTVLIKDNKLTLDVGAVAKGFAAEEVAKKMLKGNMDGYLLNLGGNVKIVGKRADGQKWKVGIENPDEESSQAYIEQLELDGNMSLVTSGSYQRFYTVNGENYHHIIDLSTLYPAEYFVSVSVLCENSALADGLSTALFCMPYEQGKKLLEQFENVNVLWVLKDGKKLYSKGFENFITK